MRFLIPLIACLLLACSTAHAQAPVADPIAAEMQRHNTEIARLLQREPFRFTSAEAPAASVPAAPAPQAAGTTCNCSVTGVCTCNPATCMCAACANGSVRMMNASVTTTQIGQPVVLSVGQPVVTRTWVSTAPTYQPAASVPLGYSAKVSPNGSYAAVSNFVGADGRRIILYSDDRQGRKLKRHTQRGVKLGVE
jgi:hypothetical protein